MHGLPGAWDCVAWATDTTTGTFAPEHADGWPSQYEYQLAIWERILAGLPQKPTGEQLDKFFYGNARAWIDRAKDKRKRAG
jgi:hypothetical protein